MPIRAYPYDWVDAFTKQAFGGNGCVVVHDADDLTVEQRVALVKETSLSECAYVVKSDVADFGARYYLADHEILMAGHPTIATVASLVSRRLVDLSGGQANFTLEVGAGVLPITVVDGADGPMITMTQLKPEFGMPHDPEKIADIYGLTGADIVGTPQTVSTGSAFYITVLKDKSALRRAVLNPEKLYAYTQSLGVTDDAFQEPFLVTLGGETETGDTFSRLLLPPPSPAEDPFTGSATGCMAAYLWHHGLIETPDFVAEQGHWMGRPGTAQIVVLGPRDAPTGVKVGGQGRILMRGELLLQR